MGLFGNPNRKVEKVIKQLQNQGARPDAYKSRKSCSNCRYFSSSGNCTCHNGRTSPQGFCSSYGAK